MSSMSASQGRRTLAKISWFGLSVRGNWNSPAKYTVFVYISECCCFQSLHNWSTPHKA